MDMRKKRSGIIGAALVLIIYVMLTLFIMLDSHQNFANYVYVDGLKSVKPDAVNIIG